MKSRYATGGATVTEAFISEAVCCTRLKVHESSQGREGELDKKEGDSQQPKQKGEGDETVLEGP